MSQYAGQLCDVRAAVTPGMRVCLPCGCDLLRAQAEAAARAAARAELEAKRKQYLRTLFMNEAHFIQDWEDPLEGLTPTQIEELVLSAGISPDDPFEVR